MGFTISGEVLIFLYSALSGALIMLFYDIVSVAGKKSECPLFILHICDGIFVTIACVIMLFINLSVSNGIVRGFEFFGAFLGGLIYKITLSRLTLFLFHKITVILTAFFKFFFKILLTPAKFMYKMLDKCINVLLCPVVRFLKRAFSYFSYKAGTCFKTACKAIKKT